MGRMGPLKVPAVPELGWTLARRLLGQGKPALCSRGAEAARPPVCSWDTSSCQVPGPATVNSNSNSPEA